jgi:hypothetical protein
VLRYNDLHGRAMLRIDLISVSEILSATAPPP